MVVSNAFQRLVLFNPGEDYAASGRAFGEDDVRRTRTHVRSAQFNDLIENLTESVNFVKFKLDSLSITARRPTCRKTRVGQQV